MEQPEEVPKKPTAPKVNLECRMYEETLPDADTCVMVNVRQITDVGTYVHLLEYNNIEGMILLSELTRRRVRSIAKLVRVGKTEVAVVIRVDKDKGYIDLSKRRASAEEIAACEEKYQKSKSVHSISRHVAEMVGVDLEEIYKQYVWPLYKSYGHAYEAFKLAIVEPETVFTPDVVPERIRYEFLKSIKKRLTPPPIKIRSDVEVSCFGYEGIDAVKQALIQGRDAGTDDCKISIKLIAPPLYVMEATCIDKQLGIDIMEKAIVEIEKTIVALSGTCVVKMKPRVISQSDERELESMLAQAGQDNNMDSEEEDEE